MKKILNVFSILCLLGSFAFSQKSPAPNDRLVFYRVSSFQTKFLLQSLEKRLKKDEFESKAEYKNRLIKLLKDIYLGEHKNQTLYEMWLPVNTRIKYDAETKVFETTGVNDFTFDYYMNVLDFPDEKISLFSDIPSSSSEWSRLKLLELKLTLPMQSNEARKNSPNLKLGMLGTVFGYDEKQGFLFVPHGYMFFNKETDKLFKSGYFKKTSKKD